MSIFSDLFERRSALPLNDAQAWRDIGWSPKTAAGVHVSTEGSLKYAAVYAAVRILAGTLAQLPLMVYQRRPDGGRDRAIDYYLYDLLHNQPNPLMTSFNFRIAMQGHLALWGNAYAEIEYSNAGRVLNLWPLLPNKMENVRTNGGSLLYDYRLPDHSLVTLPQRKVLHLRFMSPDGVRGYSPIRLHRQGIGLALAAEEFGARFFGNGANMSGVLMHPGVLDDEGFDNLKEQWDGLYSGLSNAQRTAILEEGMKYERIGIPPEDAQFLETRQFQRTEIYAMYGVPPHMAGDVERSTSWGTGIEQQAIGFIVYTMGPWLACWEQGMNTNLLTQEARRKYYTEFLVEGLLRGDSAARASYYTSMFNIGVLSQNDIRLLENMNPVSGGDQHFVPLNMIPLDQAGLPPVTTEPAPPEEPPANDQRSLDMEERAQRSATTRHRLQRVHLRVFEDVAGRILRREANDVSNAAARFLNKRTVPEFTEWLDEFYAEHAEFSARQWMPVLTAYATLIAQEAGAEVNFILDENRLTAFIQSYAETLGQRQATRSRERLDAILEEFGPDALGEIERATEQWRDTRPAGVANEETVRSNGAVSKLVYVAAGVTFLRWYAIGKTCPYCTRMNGRVVGIQTNFMSAGETIGGDAPNGPLTVSRDVGHPPIHRGCDCQLVAG